MEPYWYCRACASEVDGGTVTNAELHETCGHPVMMVDDDLRGIALAGWRPIPEHIESLPAPVHDWVQRMLSVLAGYHAVNQSLALALRWERERAAQVAHAENCQCRTCTALRAADVLERATPWTAEVLAPHLRSMALLLDPGEQAAYSVLQVLHRNSVAGVYKRLDRVFGIVLDAFIAAQNRHGPLESEWVAIAGLAEEVGELAEVILQKQGTKRMGEEAAQIAALGVAVLYDLCQE